VIQLDFDVTLTKNNIGVEIMDYFSVQPSDLEAVHKAYDKHEITLDECVEKSWKHVPATEKEITHFAMQHALFRGSFYHFQTQLALLGEPFIIVSMGHPAYIKPFLDVPFPSQAVITNHFVKVNGFWKVMVIPNLKRLAAETFYPSMIAGDSLSDWAAAVAVHKRGGKVFAPVGSSLSKTPLFDKEAFDTSRAYTYETLEELASLMIH